MKTYPSASEWQPVRIAPFDFNAPIHEYSPESPWVVNIGKVVRVRPVTTLQMAICGVRAYEIHPDDREMLGVIYGDPVLCEHQIQAD